MASANPRSVPVSPPQVVRSRREYWRALIAECGHSGLSQAEFCRRRGIPPGTLSCWKSKLAHEADPGIHRAASVASRPPARPAFVPLRVVAPRSEDPEGGPPAGAGELEIALGGERFVRVRGRVDAHWLGQVLQVLEAPRC